MGKNIVGGSYGQIDSLPFADIKEYLKERAKAVQIISSKQVALKLQQDDPVLVSRGVQINSEEEFENLYDSLNLLIHNKTEEIERLNTLIRELKEVCKRLDIGRV